MRVMKTFSAVLMVVLVTGLAGCFFQTPDQASDQADVKAPAGDGWLTDFEQAKKVAAAKKLPILADFSGSDWCGWCVKLDNEVFSKKEFQAYAADNLVLFLADFPRQKQQAPEIKAQNKKLSAHYGVRGFPTVLLLDAQGKVLAKTGYQAGGPENYVKHLKSLNKK